MVELDNRFWSKVEKTDSCWNWKANTVRGNYGRFKYNKKEEMAHRLSYENSKGVIPQGLVLDHLCKNPKCVNPSHLEAVTQRENVLRGNTLPAKNILKTHCPEGHEFTPENTYISKGKYGNSRNCRTCHNLQQQEYMERKNGSR